MNTLPRPLARTRFMTRSGTEADVVIMCQKIGYVFLTIKCGDFKVGFALIDCRTLARKKMAHPGRAGAGHWSFRLEPAGQSPPIRATIPCATADRAGRRLMARGSARCGLVPEVGSGAWPPFVFMGSLEIRETPVWNMTIN